MSPASFAPFASGAALPLDRVPAYPFDELRRRVADRIDDGWRVVAFFGMRPRAAGADSAGTGVELVAVLADDVDGRLAVATTSLPGAEPHFATLTPDCPQVHLFEREIAEQCGVRVPGHPWPKPVRFAPPFLAPGGDGARAAHPEIGHAEFFRMEGEEVHEVAVGPVHAGVIEPGHFRFQCHGEHVFHLEISLGYQHRGIEEAAIGGPRPITLHQMETAAGDTTIGHGWAHSSILESLAGAAAPPRAQVLRGIALELERLANHAGDLGALAGDVGYLPTMSFCGRLRGDFLNLTASLCGNRFGRSLVVPGGTRFDLAAAECAALLPRLLSAQRDLAGAVELLWLSPSVMARFEGTGAVRREDALRLGLVGPAARACGIERDVRQDHPGGPYRFAHIPVSIAQGGDVRARAIVRALENERSIEFIRERLASLPEGGTRAVVGPLAPNHIAATLVEGWRGEICHVAVTDAAGKFARYKIVDPSFHNWHGLAMAMREQQISDFPLTNKSFNLSYCGHDL
jgi:Ni,Fe-hydrogenase III large subunit